MIDTATIHPNNSKSILTAPMSILLEAYDIPLAVITILCIIASCHVLRWYDRTKFVLHFRGCTKLVVI